MKSISVSDNFTGGCPNLNSLTIGYGKSRASSKSKSKSKGKKPAPKKRAVSKSKSKGKKPAPKKRAVSKSKSKSKSKKPATKKKPKSKIVKKRPISKKPMKRRRGGANQTEDQVQQDSIASVPPALLVAKYGYPLAKALARKGPTIYRINADDPSLDSLRQEALANSRNAQQQYMQDNKTIYDIQNPNNRYSGDASYNEAEDNAEADGADDVANVGDDTALAGEDTADIFADGALLLGLGKKKKRTTSKKPIKKVVKKKSIKKVKKGGSVGSFVNGIWNGLKSGTQWQAQGDSQNGQIAQYNPNAPHLTNDQVAYQQFNKAISSLPQKLQNFARAHYQSPQQNLNKALNAVPSVKQFVLSHENETPQQNLMNALNAVPSVKQFVMEHSPLLRNSPSIPAPAPAPPPSNNHFFSFGGKNKKGGSLANLVPAVFDIFGHHSQPAPAKQQIDYTNLPMATMQTLVPELARHQALNTASASAPIASIPQHPITHFFSFGGAKRMKDISLASAEKELKGAKNRFETEKKQYLLDFKMKTIYENGDKLPKRQYYQPGKDGDKQLQSDMKEFNKKISEIVSEEKFNMEEQFKRLLAEATTNVYTELFNQIRSNRPNFQKYNYV